MSNNNNGLFSIQPVISPSGVLTYTPAANANGSATISVQLNDNGGTANGGVDTSATQTFTITVTAVNQAPSFAKGQDQTAYLNDGTQTVNGWATNLSAGPANESGQALTFLVSNDNGRIFSVQPAISATGVLTYTPAANAIGSATVSVQLHDDGGTANGGVDTSAPQTFTITLIRPNQAPTFTKGLDQTVLENAGGQTVNPWATAISAGAPNESTQTLNFIVSNNNNGLFSSQPAISPSGVLTYTPAANASGSALVSVQLHDNGGTAHGGVDTSGPQTFTITVNAAPVVTTDPTSQTVNAGQSASFSAAATGTPNPTVQWQVSTDGGASFQGLMSSAIQSATETGATVTVNTIAAHGFQPGQSVTVSGVSVAGYNGTFPVVTTPTATSFTYTAASAGFQSAGGGSAVLAGFTGVSF